MGANNSTLLEIVVEDAPLKPGDLINGEVVLTTIELLKDAALSIDISATAVNETNFSHTSDYTIQINMAPGQKRHKIKIPIILNKSAVQGPKKGTMRILVNASLADYTWVRLDKELTIQLRE